MPVCSRLGTGRLAIPAEQLLTQLLALLLQVRCSGTGCQVAVALVPLLQ